MTNATELELACSFCQTAPPDVEGRVFVGAGVAICGGCISRFGKLQDEVAAGDWDHLRRPLDGHVSDEQLIESLRLYHYSLKQAEAALHVHVRSLRARKITWARIGEALGMTRQAAWERFGNEE